MPGHSFRSSVNVRFADCDPAGIVFYPRYFEMINGVVEDWLASALGWSFSHIIVDRGEGLPTVNIECQFMRPSRMGEILDFELSLAALGTRSCTLKIVAKSAGATVLRATHVLVYVSGGREGEAQSTDIPEPLRQRIATFHGVDSKTVNDGGDSSSQLSQTVE